MQDVHTHTHTTVVLLHVTPIVYFVRLLSFTPRCVVPSVAVDDRLVQGDGRQIVQQPPVQYFGAYFYRGPLSFNGEHHSGWCVARGASAHTHHVGTTKRDRPSLGT